MEPFDGDEYSYEWWANVFQEEMRQGLYDTWLGEIADTVNSRVHALGVPIPVANNDPIVSVPVPRSQIRSVYRALAQPTTGQSGLAYSTATEPTAWQLGPVTASEPSARQLGPAKRAAKTLEVTRQGWTASMISQYEAELKHPLAREILTLVAKQAPMSVSIEQVMQASEVENFATVAGATSVLTKTARRLFGNNSPLFARQDSTAGATYSMDPQIARWWIEASSE